MKLVIGYAKTSSVTLVTIDNFTDTVMKSEHLTGVRYREYFNDLYVQLNADNLPEEIWRDMTGNIWCEKLSDRVKEVFGGAVIWTNPELVKAEVKR